LEINSGQGFAEMVFSKRSFVQRLPPPALQEISKFIDAMAKAFLKKPEQTHEEKALYRDIRLEPVRTQ
jgi:hypothetical protein